MSGTLSGLYVTHRKQREQERAKRAQYWREQVILLWPKIRVMLICKIQNAFHQNLMQMRETARASILSLPNHGAREGDYRGGDLSDESHSLQEDIRTATLRGR